MLGNCNSFETGSIDRKNQTFTTRFSVDLENDLVWRVWSRLSCVMYNIQTYRLIRSLYQHHKRPFHRNPFPLPRQAICKITDAFYMHIIIMSCLGWKVGRLDMLKKTTAMKWFCTEFGEREVGCSGRGCCGIFGWTVVRCAVVDRL